MFVRNSQWKQVIEKIIRTPEKWTFSVIRWEGELYEIAHRNGHLAVIDRMPPASLAKFLCPTRDPFKASFNRDHNQGVDWVSIGHTNYKEFAEKCKSLSPAIFETRELTEEEQQNIFI
jgi:hypothetical protein